MMPKKIKDYGADSIQTLEGIEAIRLRAGMYVGSITQDGLQHICLEVISNAVDEYLNNSCTLCTIKVLKDNSIIIEDDGRGVPFGKNDKGEEVLVNIYTKLHTGAKFDSNGESGYNTSGGQNGVGVKATNALSESFYVQSWRDGKTASALFKQGKLINYQEERGPDKKHGTQVTFLPDKSIFKEGIELDYARLRNQIKELAFLSPGMEFSLTYKDKPEEQFLFRNGLMDYIEELNEKKNPLTSIFYTEIIEGRIGVKVALQYNDSFSDIYKLYTNSIPNSGGTHLTGFRTALTQAVNSYARDSKLLKDKDENLSGDELKEGLTLVLSLIMPDPVFSGQTKDVLSSPEGRTIVQRLVTEEFQNWLTANPKDGKVIVEKALLARLAREKARKAKEAVRMNGDKKSKIFNLPTKLVDCWSKNRSKCELYITEGDSAANGLVASRNSEYQSVFPIRGKIINTFKATDEKILANQEVVNIIKALGLDFDTKTHKLKYESEKLRYGKIIFATDAK